MTAGTRGTRGTTNGNVRGSSYDRQRRREWLVQTYRANVDVRLEGAIIISRLTGRPLRGGWQLACRCYRCGTLLTVDTVTVDRIVPGAQGGTYRRSNIRPSCQPCASRTGAQLGAERRRAKSER